MTLIVDRNFANVSNVSSNNLPASIMELSTETRHLTPSLSKKLEQILEERESWKLLMSIVPKSVPSDTYECNVQAKNANKYTFEHIKLLENASKKDTRTPSEIFLLEWGCSGRTRPKLGHLLHLLKKAELYRAAEFLSKHVLNLVEPLQRPIDGPAAKIDLLDTEPEQNPDTRDTIINNLNNDVDNDKLNEEHKEIVKESSTVPILPISDPMVPALLNEAIAQKKYDILDTNSLPSSIMDDSDITSSDFTPDFKQLGIEVKQSQEVSDMIKFSEPVASTTSSSMDIMDIPVMILDFGKK